MLNEPPTEGDRRQHPLEQEPAETKETPDEPDDTGPKEKPRRKLHPLEQQAVDARQAMERASSQPQQHVTFHMEVVRPRLTFALITINVIIFFVAFVMLSDFQRADLYQWGVNNARQVFEFGEYHRLFSAMFLHAGLTHIAFNMLSLYYIGPTVERFFGVARFALIYFLGGLMGSLLSVLLNGPQVNSVGASGALFAIVGAQIVFLYKHRKLFRQMAQAQLRSLLFIVFINIALGFAGSFSDQGVNIDNWGHVGGLIGGLVLAWYICPDLLPKRHPDRENAFLIVDLNPLNKHFQTIVLFISFLLALLIGGTLLAG